MKSVGRKQLKNYGRVSCFLKYGLSSLCASDSSMNYVEVVLITKLNTTENLCLKLNCFV